MRHERMTENMIDQNLPKVPFPTYLILLMARVEENCEWVGLRSMDRTAHIVLVQANGYCGSSYCISFTATLFVA